MTTLTAHVALPILRQLRARDAEYSEACRLDAAAGYRPHYCPHGVNLWTEYDPMCGPCEDGLTIHEEALAAARRRVSQWEERAEILRAACDANAPREILDSLTTWATDALKVNR